MQHFTGVIKKSIAGFLLILNVFVSPIAFANNPPEPAERGVIANTAVENTSATTTSATNSLSDASSVQNPAPASSTVNTPITKPVTLASPKQNSASQLASLVGGLVLILVLIYGLSWFVKRFSQGGFLQNPTMKIVSAMPLGTRERLMLVDVGGKQLLLGVTATQINTLHVFDEPVASNGKDQPVASDFSQKLMSILQQKNISASGVSSTGESPDKKSSS